jgi:preprotein translocase subunit SecG
MLHSILNVVHVIVCFFLILVVLLQQGKGGGLAGLGGATAGQVFGGRGAGNFMTRLTAASAVIFMLTSVVLAYISSGGDRALREFEEAPTEPAPAPGPTP